jgi:histidinol-phosphate aminotransferase
MIEATAKIRRERTVLADRLHQLGLRVVTSQTNFLFVDLAVKAAPVAGALLQKGIIVKPWMEAGYAHFPEGEHRDSGGQ